MIKKACVISDGCKSNGIDAEEYKKILISYSYELTDSLRKADIILFLSCAFAKFKEDMAIQQIDKILSKKRKGAHLLVGGCLPSINKKRLDRHFKGISFGPLNKDVLMDYLKANSVKQKSIKLKKTSGYKRLVTIFLQNVRKALPESLIIKMEQMVVNNKHLFYNLPLAKFIFTASTGKYIKIQNGCLGNCSYCVIKVARGSLKSVPLEKVIAEVNAALSEGYTEIYLTGEDVGAYGLDIGLNICSLFRKLISIQKDFNLKLYNFNPNWFIRYYEDILQVSNSGKINCIVLPMQSGSQRILDLMKRPYNIEILKERLREYRTRFPQIQIHTHVIVGFPAEQRTDFEKTLSFLEDVRFNFVIPFTYYRREGTPAAQLKCVVDPNETKQRLKELQECLNKNQIGLR